jgi:hypothetical protein
LNDFTHTGLEILLIILLIFLGPSRLMLADNYEMFFLSACGLSSVFTARQFYWHGKWSQQVMHNWFSLKPVSIAFLNLITNTFHF